MRNPRVLLLASLGAAALIGGIGFAAVPSLGQPLLFASGALLVWAVGLWFWDRRDSRDPYDLSRLREMHEREELRSLEEGEPVGGDGVVCIGCGNPYPSDLGVCPHCGASQFGGGCCR